MSRNVKAACLYGIRDLRLEERTLTSPAPDELQIKVRSTGLCGSDQHYFNHFANGDIKVQEPLCLGHESAGEVIAVGSAVLPEQFKLGDRVALEVGKPCGSCRLCTEGRYNICPRMNFRSSAKSFPHYQGTLQESLNAPARWCYKLPDSVSTELGALIEPLSVAIHGVRRAALRENSDVLVIGAGAVGLLTCAMLRFHGARTVTVCDLVEERVALATKHDFADRGFTAASKRGTSTEDTLKIARAMSSQALEAAFNDRDGMGFDAVFECTGVESCTQAAIFASRPGGKVVLIGMGTPVQTLPLSAAALREVDILGVFRYSNTYDYAINLLSGHARSAGRGLPDLSKVITHRVQGLDNVNQAFKIAVKPKDDDGQLVLKVMVNN